MTPRERLTVAAALAVALATSALAPVYADLGWLSRVLGAVAVVAVAGLVQRRVGVPRLVQPLLSAGALVLYVCAVFAPGTLALGLPTSATLTALGDLAGQGLLDVEQLVPPVPTHPGLVLLAVAGVGAVALVVDVVAALLARPAVAGLPLLVLYVVPSAVMADGLGALPFALGATGWLVLLLVEGADRVERWGSAVRRQTPGRRAEGGGVGRVGRRIGLAAVALAVVVPAALPGLDARLVDAAAAGDGPGLGGGPRTATTYNPITRLRDDLVQPSPQPLLRYRTDDPAPDYLRLTTLDVFDGTGWSSSQLNGDRKDDAVRDGIPRPAGLSSPTRDVRTRVAIERLRTYWLPVPFPPREVDVEGPWVWDRRAETVFSTGTTTGALDEGYEVRSLRVDVDPGELSDVPPDAALPSEVRHYVDPPALTGYVRAETARAVQGAKSDFQAVKAIQDYFLDASRFRYSTSPEVPGITSPDALEAFLRGGQGFCEQYASAMAAMVRSLGLPARVAVGFTRGTRSGDEWVVTTSDAHAWPEVWFPEAGWVRFEPTPRSGATEVPDYAAAEPGAGGPATGPTPGTDEPTAEPTTSASPGAETGVDDKLDRLDEDDPAAAPAGRAPLDPASGGLPLVALGAGVAVAALAAPAVGASVLRRRRRHDGGALLAWGQLQEDAADVGHTWDGAETPRVAGSRLRRERHLPPEASAALDRVVGAVERARYAPQTSSAGAEVWDDVDVVRAALLAGAPASVRWRARLLPPSVLRAASARFGSAVADALDVVDAGFAAVGKRARGALARG